MLKKLQNVSKIVTAVVFMMVFALPVFAGGEKEAASSDSAKYEIVMVAKHEGISWFDDMRVGVDQFGEEYADVNAYQIAPEGGDPAKQVQMVEDLIAKGVDAILVVPNDPVSMIPVLRKAREKGIIVVAHEAQELAKEGVVDYDMEAFDNDDFGRLMFESLAREMNYEGEYAGIVGGLTMQTHMQWYSAGRKYAEEKYPNMKFVLTEPLEDFNTEKTSYDKTKELLKTYPNLKGLFGCSASATIMEALAVEEKGKQDEIAVVGLTLPSMSSVYLENGSLRQAQCWRPADAGYAAAMIAYNLLEGKKIETGINLQKPGYESCTVENGIVYGNAPLVLTKDNVADYPF